MEKEFLTFEQANYMCNLGYYCNEPFKVYEIKYKSLLDEKFCIYSNVEYIPAPLKQQAFKFFRDEYNLDFHIKLNWMHIDFKLTYILSINYPTISDIDFYTYEEAENFAIDVLIKIAKEQQLENNQ